MKAVRRLLLCLALLCPALSWAATNVTFAWDAVDGATGYKIYCSNSSGVYASPVDVGNVTSATVPVPSGKDYFCAAKAYNASGDSTAYSSCTTTGAATCSGGELLFHIKPEAPSNVRVGP